MSADNPTWHVLGAGSIGCLFAAYLQRAGCAIELILRDAGTLAQLHSAGGIALEREADTTLVPVRGISVDTPDTFDATGVTGAQIDHLLICTKAQQTVAALRPILPYLGENPVIVLLQNGMGVREKVLQAIPDAIVLHAITTEGAYRRARFHVVHAGFGETLIGAIEQREQPIAESAAATLRSELRIAVVTDIEQRLWRKLAINSVINPLTALHGCRNGELLKLPDMEARTTQLCAEFALVAAAEGQQFSAQALATAAIEVMRATAANRSSMLQDILAGRRTEIEFINGFIVRKALQHGIACPQQIALYDAIRNSEHAFS